MATTFTCKELLVLKTEERRDGKSVLRVVQWNKYKPKLEKRGFYQKDGEFKTGKAEGLSLADLKLIIEKQDEIIAQMTAEPKDTPPEPADSEAEMS